mmetsp:Transcript_23812/g.34784  ORF Transcript_23812/g.34784 Transcript_23812/m.34784 type:complete len:520 (+) Transcript_23812:111-1670(+)
MTKSAKSNEDERMYQNGFGNEFQTEAVTGALPKFQNNPLRTPYNLYAEQISGTAFTKARHSNLRTWMYRIRPSVSGYETKSEQNEIVGEEEETACSPPPYTKYKAMPWFGNHNPNNNNALIIDPNPLRWKPMPIPFKEEKKVTFVDGCQTYTASGDVGTKSGVAIHLYAFNTNMSSDRNNTSMYNSDGDFLIVPQFGTLKVITELGVLMVQVGEICVIPRGIVFCVDVVAAVIADGSDTTEDGTTTSITNDDGARGYVLEIYKGHFTLPELGPIGSNGLANARDFQYPVASFDDDDDDDHNETTAQNNKNKQRYRVVNKFCNKLFERVQNHTPFNVVAWHGNYSPFKYDLSKFCTINSVSFDHPDPSIYTVLTAKSDEDGTPLTDFVIFPPRWMVMEHTFRPPYFHRNVMSEFMGMIYGRYDAKSGSGFGPGSASLHNVMTPHGPDRETVLKEDGRVEGSVTKDQPVKFTGGLAFMFETSHVLKLTQAALRAGNNRDMEYHKCWEGIPVGFSSSQKEKS